MRPEPSAQVEGCPSLGGGGGHSSTSTAGETEHVCIENTITANKRGVCTWARCYLQASRPKLLKKVDNVIVPAL